MGYSKMINNFLFFSDQKHFKVLLPNLKFLPCYSNEKFKARKLYLGNIFSGCQTDLCSNQTLYANGFSYFSVKNSTGIACLSNGFSILSVDASYELSKSYFNINKNSNCAVWTFAKSNFFVNRIKKEKIEQLRNFSVRSYRSKLSDHLCAPFSRQDEALGKRLSSSAPDYSIRATAQVFCHFYDKNESLSANGLLVPSSAFYKIFSFFTPAFLSSITFFKRQTADNLFINTNFLNLSARENTVCAKVAISSVFASVNYNSLKFSNNHSFRNFFFNGRDFPNYLLNLKKNLPLQKPLTGVRFNLLNFVIRNAFLKRDNRSSVNINRKWVKDHYEILYNDFLKISPTATKLISYSSHFSNVISKTFLKSSNLESTVLARQLFNKQISYSAFFSYFGNLSKIFNSRSLENFFSRDLQYKKNRFVSYRRARVSKYYKSLWYLPDNKSMKTRRRR